jgi:3-isopropylmalate dehydrogenase
MVRRPWEFDVCPTENQFGDILSDLAAALMGGLGMAPSGEFGDNNAVFQPCHGTAPHLAGTGKANPTGMVLSGAMMLDYLGEKFDNPNAIKAGNVLTEAVKDAYRYGNMRPHELRGDTGTEEILIAIENQINNFSGE